MIQYDVLFKDGFKLNCRDHCFRGLGRREWDTTMLGRHIAEQEDRVRNYKNHELSAVVYNYLTENHLGVDKSKEIAQEILDAVHWFKTFVVHKPHLGRLFFYSENQPADKMFMTMSIFRNILYIHNHAETYVHFRNKQYSPLASLLMTSFVYKRQGLMNNRGKDYGIRNEGDYSWLLADSFGENAFVKFLSSLDDPQGPGLWTQDLWNNQYGYMKVDVRGLEFISPLGERRDLRNSDGMSISGDAYLFPHVELDEDGNRLATEADISDVIGRFFQNFNLQLKV